MQIQNNFSNNQSSKLFHVNNFKKYVAVTSIYNLTINHKNIINFFLNAFALMSNKSLTNRYATTGTINGDM